MKKVLMAVLMCGAAFAQTKTTAKSAAKSTAKAAPTRNLLDPSTLKAIAPATYKVKLVTSQGDILIQVTRAWAPRGADRFYNLVRGGFFTNAPFFRVIPNFMAQFGISARPDVNKAWANASIQDDPVKASNKRGMVTFAATGAPNSRGTQLFINTGDNARLDADRFAPFGEVLEGIELVDKFYSGYGGSPDQDALQNGGKAYVDRKMPKVDFIKTASIVPATPPAAKAAPAAKGTTGTKK